MNLKKELIVVFHPYVPKGKQRPFRYRCISANRLHEYIGEQASERMEAFLKSGLQKDDFYVAKHGKVYLYRK